MIDSTVGLQKKKSVIASSTSRLSTVRAKWSLWLHSLYTISVFAVPFNWLSIMIPKYLYWLTLSTDSLSMVIQAAICLLLVQISINISLAFFTFKFR